MIRVALCISKQITTLRMAKIYFEIIFSSFYYIHIFPIYMPQLMTPFKDNGHLRRDQREFNRKLRKTSIVVEHAFGIL